MGHGSAMKSSLNRNDTGYTCTSLYTFSPQSTHEHESRSYSCAGKCQLPHDLSTSQIHLIWLCLFTKDFFIRVLFPLFL